MPRADRRRVWRSAKLFRIRIELEIIERDREYVFGNVEHIDAAVGEFFQKLSGLKTMIPGIDRLIADPLACLGDIVGDAGREPHVIRRHIDCRDRSTARRSIDSGQSPFRCGSLLLSSLLIDARP